MDLNTEQSWENTPCLILWWGKTSSSNLGFFERDSKVMLRSCSNWPPIITIYCPIFSILDHCRHLPLQPMSESKLMDDILVDWVCPTFFEWHKLHMYWINMVILILTIIYFPNSNVNYFASTRSKGKSPYRRHHNRFTSIVTNERLAFNLDLTNNV